MNMLYLTNLVKDSNVKNIIIQNTGDNIGSIINVIFAGISALCTIYNIYLTQENRFYQTNKIAAWVNGTIKINGELFTECEITNLSNMNIHNVVITPTRLFHDNTIEDAVAKWRTDPDCGGIIYILPPGKFTFNISELDFSMNKIYGLDVAFIDSNGNSWRMMANGKIKNLKSKDPFSLYKIPMPFSPLMFETIN